MFFFGPNWHFRRLKSLQVTHSALLKVIVVRIHAGEPSRFKSVAYGCSLTPCTSTRTLKRCLNPPRAAFYTSATSVLAPSTRAVCRERDGDFGWTAAAQSGFMAAHPQAISSHARAPGSLIRRKRKLCARHSGGRFRPTPSPAPHSRNVLKNIWQRVSRISAHARLVSTSLLSNGYTDFWMLKVSFTARCNRGSP